MDNTTTKDQEHNTGRTQCPCARVANAPGRCACGAPVEQELYLHLPERRRVVAVVFHRCGTTHPGHCNAWYF